MKKLLCISMILLIGLILTGCKNSSCKCGTIVEKTIVNQPDGNTWALKIDWDCDKNPSIRNVDAQTGNSYSVGDHICF